MIFENHLFHIPDSHSFRFVLSGFYGTPDAALEIPYFGVRALKAPACGAASFDSPSTRRFGLALSNATFSKYEDIYLY